MMDEFDRGGRRSPLTGHTGLGGLLLLRCVASSRESSAEAGGGGRTINREGGGCGNSSNGGGSRSGDGSYPGPVWSGVGRRRRIPVGRRGIGMRL